MDIDTFQSRINIRFHNQSLLREALTHRSFVNEQEDEQTTRDNERMEFLGDAVLDYITASLIFKQFPDMPEGQMTRLRAALVRTEALALLARQCQLGEAMLMGKGEVNSGGRERINNLCGGFEAVVGAIYLDQGLEAVKDFVTPLLLELQKDVIEEALRKDPRSQFQEWTQSVLSITPEFHVVDTVGPEHEKEFIVIVVLDDQIVAAGQGPSKRAGAQSAARIALEKVNQSLLPFIPLPETMDSRNSRPEPDDPSDAPASKRKTKSKAKISEERRR